MIGSNFSCKANYTHVSNCLHRSQHSKGKERLIYLSGLLLRCALAQWHSDNSPPPKSSSIFFTATTKEECMEQTLECHWYGISVNKETNIPSCPWLSKGWAPDAGIIQHLWVIWVQCCLRLAAGPCLPNGPIMQLSPYLTQNPCSYLLPGQDGEEICQREVLTDLMGHPVSCN